MKKLFLLSSAMLLLSHVYKLCAQTGDFGLSITINSIQGQIAVPIMTGQGALLVDADGNIVVTGGNRTDNSYSYSIVPKYYINKDILLRFEFGLTNLSLKANANYNLVTVRSINNVEVTNKIFRYTPGVQWFFMKERKIESYFGMTASYINYQSIYYNYSFEHRDVVTDTILDLGTGKQTTPGGFGVGVGAFAGFNIYLRKRISLGAEVASSALYYKLGGETIDEVVGILPAPTISATETYTNSYKGFRISKIISSFNITFWL